MLIPTVNLKSKRASNLASKPGLFRDSREPQLGTSKAQQNRGKSSSKGEGLYFIERKEEVGRDCCEGKVCCRKVRVQGDDGFSLAELLSK